jgi:hypothetical protein
LKNAVFWDFMPVALLRTDVAEKRIATIIRVSVIGKIGTTLVVTSKRVGLWRLYIPPKRRFFQEPHCVTPQKAAFFILTAVKTSNLA